MMHLASLANVVAGSTAGTAAPSGPAPAADPAGVAAFLPQLQELLAAAVLVEASSGCLDGDLLGEGGCLDVDAMADADQAIDTDGEVQLAATWALPLGHLVARPVASVVAAPLDLDASLSSEADASLDDVAGPAPAAGTTATEVTGDHGDATTEARSAAPTDMALDVPAEAVSTVEDPATTGQTVAAAARTVPATRAVPATPVRGQPSAQDGLVPGAHRATPAEPAQPAVHQRDATRSPVLAPTGAEPSVGMDTTAASLPATVGAPVRPSNGTPAAPVSSAAQRVLEAIELLETAPPPRQLTLELGEVRLRVALEDGQVRLTLLGERSAAADEALREARAELDARGFDLGRQRDGQAPDGEDAPTPRRPSPSTSRRDDDLRL